MFSKILIVDDHEMINKGVEILLDELKVKEVNSVKYCDDAFQKIQYACTIGKPFELLLTDLSFSPDYRGTTIQSGADLITAVKVIQPDIKVIVYSVNDASYIIDRLFSIQKIDRFIAKGRDCNRNISLAVNSIYNNNKQKLVFGVPNYRPEGILEKQNKRNIRILELLSEGISINKIPGQLQTEDFDSVSLSFVEKHIATTRSVFDAKNNIHLITILKKERILK